MSQREMRRASRRGALWEGARDYFDRGIALRDQGRLAESEASLRHALTLKPEFEDAHNILGNVLRDLGRSGEAETSYQQALELKPGFPEAHNSLGNVLGDQGRLEEAETSYRRALKLNPDLAVAHSNLGNVLRGQRRLKESEASCRRAIELDPALEKAHSNLGIVLQDKRELQEGEVSLRHALKLKPGFWKAHNNLGNVLWEQGRLEEAETSYRRALELCPDFALAHSNLANVLRSQRRWEEAEVSGRRAIELMPATQKVTFDFGALADTRLQICDWSDFAHTARELTKHVREARSIVFPFIFLAFSDDPGDQLRCAQQYIEHKIGPRSDPVVHQTGRVRDRIRLGYISADFHDHATSFLMAELFELHDRKRFEIFAFSFGRDAQGPMRRRIRQAFDHFIDIRNMSDAEAAEQIRELGIDIAIDLKGYTTDTRPGILAPRPAPVQVNYLGYPGTLGVDFVDYILVDPFIVPLDQQPHFTEKLVQLPDCYQVNDTKRAVAEVPPSRASCGLPEDGFVFCCFNQNYKITPTVFDVWMQLLRSVPGSTLWLLRGNEVAERNLRQEAQARDIEPDRLVFAPRLQLQDHLARHTNADLFLDTLPYNAHTTASDALWVGLPVLTCVGRAFPGRVAGSLLHALGLPKLITNSLEDYEALALRLVGDPEYLSTIRAKLARNRDTAPLFDTNRFRLNMEAAYAEMWQTWQSGRPPRAIAV